MFMQFFKKHAILEIVHMIFLEVTMQYYKNVFVLLDSGHVFFLNVLVVLIRIHAFF